VKKEKLIDIHRLIKSKNPKLLKWLPRFVIRYLRRILHEDEINEFIEKHDHLYDESFCQAIVDYFNIKVVIKGIENLPESGPTIVAMNHPLGGMDAVAFVAGIKEKRKDVRFVVNDLLMSLENLKNLFVGVNKHGKNAPSVRQQIRNIFDSDKLVCIFPAGMVSRKIKGEVKDLMWKKTFVQYGREFNRPIVPVYIDGELTNFFYRLSKIRKFVGIKANIEMMYLADELFKQKNRTITFTIGEPIYGSTINPEWTDIEASEWFRKHVHQFRHSK
jgi:putative hemolysin